MVEYLRQDMREELNGYDPVEEMRSQLNPDFPSWHPLNQAQYLEMKLLLAGYLLSSQGERMAMANSVEADTLPRPPPGPVCGPDTPRSSSGLKEKHVLKKAFMGRLPARSSAGRSSPMARRTGTPSSRTAV